MKVLFCHDGPLRKDEYGNFFGTAHNDDSFKRYYNIADELTCIIRVKDIQSEETNDKLSRISVQPFNVVPIPNISSFKGSIFHKKEAKRVVKEQVECSDFVVARLPSLAGFLGVDYAKKMGKPYLVEVVACPWDAFWNHSIIGKFIAPTMYWKTKQRVLNSNYSVYVTNDFLQKRYPTKGESVSCSNVALVDFEEQVLSKRLDKIHSMQDNEKIIIGTTAAVNVKYKGQQYIIEALGRLKKDGITNYEYHLVGGGDTTFLRKVADYHGVSEEVKFIGSMSHEMIFEWLETIDIYAQPSRQEGLPRALIEAMSRGLPALGAKTAGIPELIESDCIFSNTRNNINEICSILKGLNKNKMLELALSNYSESKKYESKIIEERRKSFFENFVKKSGI
jgi:glycosyltransferase involved in cell wall biosynthesis